MFGNMNLGDMGKMLQDMQDKMKEQESANEAKEFTAKSGGGMVSVTMNGKGETVDVTLDDSLLEDKESLQILLISAINDANKMVEDNKKHAAMNMMGGMGMFGNQG